MTIAQEAFLYVAGGFAAMLAMMELGRRLSLRRRAIAGAASESGLGAVDAAVFGLLGLMVAFAFSGAHARFEWRRGLIVEEANDIGTAYLRLDLLPAAAQPALREKFRVYVDSRLTTYAAPDLASLERHLARTDTLQQELWADAVAASRQSGPMPAPMLLLPALNAMFDVANTRTRAIMMHTPKVIYWLLGALALTTALLAGYDMAGNGARNWVHILCLTTVLTITVYVIVDLEYPRSGLIDLRPYDQAIIDARAAMK